METYNVTNARADLYNLVNKVNENHEPIQIQGKKGDAVLVSASDWMTIEETLYLYSVPGMVEDLINSLDESFETMKNANELQW